MDAEEDNTNRKLLLFANQLKAGRGLTMTATLIEGDIFNPEEEAKSRAIKDVSHVTFCFFCEIFFFNTLSRNYTIK